MSQVQTNLIANFLGKLGAAFLNFVFIPKYVELLGMEAYGLVGFFSILVGVLSVLDLGFTTTLNRELAAHSSQPGRGQEMRELVSTLGLVYCLLALLIALGVSACAPLLAKYWVVAEGISLPMIHQAIALMGVTIAMQMLYGFCAGGLLGLQKHVLCNAMLVLVTLLRTGGAVLALVFLSKSITTFFAWQAGVSALSVILVGTLLWTSLPSHFARVKIRWSLVSHVSRFCVGLSASAVVGLLLAQADKLALSKMLPLEEFGYYMIAASFAAALNYLGTPVYSAYFPLFTQSVERRDNQGLAARYHIASQLMAILVLPAAAVIVIAGDAALGVWSFDAATVAKTHAPLRLLGFAAALNQLASIPYGMQLAHGWAGLGFITNLAALVLLFPLLMILVPLFGPIGAASISLTLNVGYVFVYVQVMHCFLLRGEQWRWYAADVLPILISSFSTVAILLAGIHAIAPQLPDIFKVGLMYAGALTAAILASSVGRARLVLVVQQRKWAWTSA